MDRVSLVPARSTQSSRNKKKRPGFRPVVKHKSSSTTTSNVKNKGNSNNQVTEGTAVAAQTSDTTNKAENLARKSTRAAGKSDLETSQGLSETAVGTNSQNDKVDSQKSNIEDSNLQEQLPHENEDTMRNETTTVSTNTASMSKSSLTKNTTGRSARKRKHGTPNSIQIGATRKTRSMATRDSNAENDDNINEQPQQGDLENLSNVNRKQREPSEGSVAITTLTTADQTDGETSTAIVAVSQDQAILERLGAENTTGLRLASFCSQFKCERPKKQQKSNTEANKNKKTGKRRKKNQQQDPSSTTATTSNNDGDGDVGNKDTDDGNQTADATQRAEHVPAGVPVVEIIDGEIVLQESSLVLPTRRSVQEVEEEFQDNVVEEDAQLAIVQASYTSFLTKGNPAANGGKKGPNHWTIEETEKFYVALRQLGTDFGSMEAYFDNKRTRRQLKKKYQKELITNPNLVEELALNPKYKTDLDISAFNVEVDPKRIEAHENEEPPPYEPTDVEETEAAEGNLESTEPAAALESAPEPAHEVEVVIVGVSSPTRNNEVIIEGNQEVVEEDAEEERKAEAAAAAAAAKDGKTASRSKKVRPPTRRVRKRKETKKVSKTPAASNGNTLLWSNAAAIDHSQEEDMEQVVDLDGFPDEDFPEPSMEDFIHEQSFDAAIEEEEEHDMPEGRARTESQTTVSLIPRKKTGAKRRRPKVRPSPRKRKK